MCNLEIPEHLTECYKKNCHSRPRLKVKSKYYCRPHGKSLRLRMKKTETLHSDVKFLRKKAKELQKTPTGAEAIFGRKLKNLGIRYTTQKWFWCGGIKGIYDFYVPKGKIVIEVDGGCHLEEDQKQTDAIKDFIAKRLGFRMVRMTNSRAMQMSDEELIRLFENNETCTGVQLAG